jgi:hypothetical protein
MISLNFNLLSRLLNALHCILKLSRTVGTVAAFLILSLSLARGETSYEINGFSGTGFSISSSSWLAGNTFSESGTSAFGSYQFTANVAFCSATRGGGIVTLVPPSSADPGVGGQASFDHVFDQPVDLSSLDYIGIDLTHGHSFNPVSLILVTLTNGKILQIQQTTTNVFGRNQTKFPIYDLVSRHGFSRYHPAQVQSLSVVIDVLSPSSMSLNAIRVVRIAPRPPLSLRFSLGGIRGAVVEANRPLAPNEIYRLEASHDLANWFDKGFNVRGDGSTPVFHKYLSDARFYRMSYYNYVDTSSNP